MHIFCSCSQVWTSSPLSQGPMRSLPSALAAWQNLLLGPWCRASIAWRSCQITLLALHLKEFLVEPDAPVEQYLEQLRAYARTKVEPELLDGREDLWDMEWSLGGGAPKWWTLRPEYNLVCWSTPGRGLQVWPWLLRCLCVPDKSRSSRFHGGLEDPGAPHQGQGSWQGTSEIRSQFLAEDCLYRGHGEPEE